MNQKNTDPVESVIYMDDELENVKHSFGESNEPTIGCYVVFPGGEKVHAQFSKNAIETAIRKANKNPEDWPEEQKSLLQSIWEGWLS